MMFIATVMFIITFGLLGYMHYHFSQVPVRTKEYIRKVRKMNRWTNKGKK